MFSKKRLNEAATQRISITGSNLRSSAFIRGQIILWSIALHAQTPTGQIRLTIEDSAGMPMQAVGKLDTRAFETDAQGQYTFANVPIGVHRLEISRTGFADQVLSVDVTSGAPVIRIVRMEVASASSRIDVVETTPLAGVDLSKEQIAAPVQTATDEDIANSGSLDLSDFMNRRLNGVYLNEIQSNPFQPDVNFRGYTASPLLGTPQGVSVYLDGVRQNQPFGDVVSWDLIPQNAISEMTLIPGSDPLFGLNTLGGALSVETKDGVSNPGLAGELTYGSSGRKAVQAEYGGGKATGFNWFFAGNGFHESGWRYDSPSDVRQGFMRLGWRTEKTDLALTASYAYNTLLGNGYQDYRLLDRDYSSAYTVPDVTANRAPQFNLIARHTFTDHLTFSGNAWFRNIRTEGINPNLNTDAFGQPVYSLDAADIAALSAAGYTGFPGAGNTYSPFPKWACIAQALELNNPDNFCDGIIIDSKEVQNEYGVSGQLTWLGNTRAGRNQFTAGAAIDRGSIDFTQNTDYAYINPNYSLTSVPAWQDGSTNNPIDSRVNLHGLTPNWSLYATDTLTFHKTWNLTVSGRYNRFTVENFDRINPIPGPGSLDGDYVFQRFNPAAGLTWSPVSAINLYASYTQGSRAPTSIELGCADPDNPCSLPNALASDPPLKQVVTGTWEAGVRGKPEVPFVHTLNWDLDAFRADNRNDILFVAAPETGAGYFQNFGRTRREGMEASVSGRVNRASWGLDYTFLDATYQSTDTLDGSANSAGVDGLITVHPGNRIPLIPKNTGKAWASIQATSKFVLDLNLIANSSSYARGNENNADVPDGVNFIGPGVSPGYAVWNFSAHYDLTKRLQIALQVDNLFDRRYYSAAQLADSGFTAQGVFTNTPQSVTFFAPGAPRRVWVELRVKL